MINVHARLNRLVLVSFVLSVVVLAISEQRCHADDKAPAAKTISKTADAKSAAAATLGTVKPTTPVAAVPAKPKGLRRLPIYFGKVIDPLQRERVYKVQEEYATKIEALKAQLRALVKERDQKFFDILRPEQRERMEQLKKESRGKRKAKAKNVKKAKAIK